MVSNGVFHRLIRRRSREGNSAKRAVKASGGSGRGTEGLGESSWVTMPWTCSWVRLSTRQRWVTSTSRLKWPRKSAPRMGCFTFGDDEGPLEGPTEA